MKALSLLLISILSLSANTQENSQDSLKWQKLDIHGKPVPIKLGPWACATDVKTGLTWEVKSWHENLHYYKATYSYFDSKLNIGVKQGGSCQAGQEWYPCDISEFIDKMNQLNYCGRNNWRLPTQNELQSLIYTHNTKGKLLINSYIFPRTTRSIYMTANVDKSNQQIMMMDFWHGKVSKRPLDVVANVRLVSDK